MAMNPWKAPTEIVTLVEELKNKFHIPRLETASIAVSIEDSKPFIRNRLNLGKVFKFSSSAKLWQLQRHDFGFSIPSDLWQLVLKGTQREAYLDLLLCRCQVEYLPEVIEENGKKRPVKDEFGRIQYTDQIKVDDEGNPKWKVSPLDLDIFTSNVGRYGLWHEGLLEFSDAIEASSGQGGVVNERA